MHVIADVLGSIGAVFAGLLMFLTSWYQVDALISIAICVLILYSSGKIIRESINVLLEAVPSHIDLDAIERKILQVHGVKSIHDLHVWCITPTKMCIMSAHVVAEESADKKGLMQIIVHLLKEEFGVDHTTIQLEDEGYPKAPAEHA